MGANSHLIRRFKPVYLTDTFLVHHVLTLPLRNYGNAKVYRALLRLTFWLVLLSLRLQPTNGTGLISLLNVKAISAMPLAFD